MRTHTKLEGSDVFKCMYGHTYVDKLITHLHTTHNTLTHNKLTHDTLTH